MTRTTVAVPMQLRHHALLLLHSCLVILTLSRQLLLLQQPRGASHR